VADVVARLEAMAPGRVVVTGGEPLLQQRPLTRLVAACAARGWPVEVETNGTRAPSDELVALVAQWNVSPKLANSGVAEAARLRPDALAAFVASGRAVFKFVATGEADLEEIGAVAAAHDLRPVWVMPEGTDTATVVARAKALSAPVLERGWQLTLRMHVLLWGDERGR
jgi:organic radical activating enzyme